VYPLTKRGFDRTLAALLVVAFAPVLAVLAVVNLVTSGRVLSSERRISRGREFALLKFATTTPSGELTWAGRRLLRPWYLDELPQLFNILRGEISFVGPRPWPPEMVARQVADGVDYRNRVVAGLTGTAQVTKGVAGTRYADLDREYVRVLERASASQLLRYDLAIIRRTLGVLARGEGLNY
jgi:lipopolysaccharide/colanic/teichoic acid biosynthesis glycosyltransferase